MKSKSMRTFRVTHELVLAIVLVGLVILFGLIEPVFFKPRVLFDVFAIIGEIGIMALGMTFVITTGGVDLAVGYSLQLSAIMFGVVFGATGNLFLAIVAALVTGAVLGMFNGTVISQTKIPPLVTTLGTMYLFRGISMIVAGTRTFSGFPDAFREFSTYELFGVLPIQFLYFLAIFLILNYFYRRGSLGRNLKGMGFNEAAVIFFHGYTNTIKF